MGVEQGEGGGLRQRGGVAQACAILRGGEPIRTARTLQRLPAVPGQKRRAGQRHGPGHTGVLAQRLRHAQHPGGDEHGVGQRAEQHHTAHVLTPQALAQHKRVLCTDGDDETQAQDQALQEDREHQRSGNRKRRHAPRVPVEWNEGKLSFLLPMEKNCIHAGTMPPSMPWSL